MHLLEAYLTIQPNMAWPLPCPTGWILSLTHLAKMGYDLGGRQTDGPGRCAHTGMVAGRLAAFLDREELTEPAVAGKVS